MPERVRAAGLGAAVYFPLPTLILIGLGLRAEAKNHVTVSDTNDSSVVQGHNFTSETEVGVSISLLGGAKTAGSDCQRVPLWANYLRPYFRCTGLNQFLPAAKLAPAVGEGDCYERALDYVATAHDHAMDSEDNATQRPWFTPGSKAQQALAFLTDGAGDPR